MILTSGSRTQGAASHAGLYAGVIVALVVVGGLGAYLLLPPGQCIGALCKTSSTTTSSSSSTTTSSSSSSSSSSSGTTTISFTSSSSTTINVGGLVSYIFPAVFTDQNTGKVGSVLQVNQNDSIATKITLYSNITGSGSLEVQIRQDIVWWPDATFKDFTQAVSLKQGTNVLVIPTFTPSSTTCSFAGCTRAYYLKVFWQGNAIYDPTDPNTREEITVASTTTTTTSTSGSYQLSITPSTTQIPSSGGTVSITGASNLPTGTTVFLSVQGYCGCTIQVGTAGAFVYQMVFLATTQTSPNNIDVSAVAVVGSSQVYSNHILLTQTPPAGTLSITVKDASGNAEPSISIFVNGQSVGTGSVTLTEPAGSYVVACNTSTGGQTTYGVYSGQTTSAVCIYQPATSGTTTLTVYVNICSYGCSPSPNTLVQLSDGQSGYTIDAGKTAYIIFNVKTGATYTISVPQNGWTPATDTIIIGTGPATDTIALSTQALSGFGFGGLTGIWALFGLVAIIGIAVAIVLGLAVRSRKHTRGSRV